MSGTITVDRGLLLRVLRLAAGAHDARAGLRAVSAVISELVWPDAGSALASAGSAPALSAVDRCGPGVARSSSVAAVARRYGKRTSSVRRAIARGRLAATKVDGRWMVDDADAERWALATAKAKAKTDPLADDRLRVEAMEQEFERLLRRADELEAEAQSLEFRIQAALAQNDPLAAHSMSKERDAALAEAKASRAKASEVRDERAPLAAWLALVEQQMASEQYDRQRRESLARVRPLHARYVELARDIEAEMARRRNHPAAEKLPKHLRDVVAAMGGASVAQWQLVESTLDHNPFMNVNGNGSM